MSAPKPWPFTAWHRLAVTTLNIPPDQFWDMPLPLWLSLLAPCAPAMGRDRLNALMKENPDD